MSSIMKLKMKKKLLMVSCLIWILLIILKILLNVAKSYFHLFLIDEEIYSYLDYLTIIISTILTVIFVKKYFEKKWLNISLSIIGFLVLFILIMINSLFDGLLVEPPNRYYFSSPSEKNELLIEEIRTITSSEVIGYKMKYKIFKHRDDNKSSVGFGEPDLPVAKGNYRIEWRNDHLVEVFIYSDSQEKSFIVRFNK